VTGLLGGGSYAGAIANAGSLLFNSSSDQTLAGGISGAGSLTKSSTNNLVLSGSNSYTGPTSITAGRLSVNGSLASSAVTVAGGTLGGTGTLAGSVAVQAGGRVSPGNSIGVLTQGDTTFDAGAIFKYEVDSTNLSSLGSAADLLVVNGNLNIAAGTLLEFSDLAGLAAQPFVEDSTVFAMINYTGTWNTGLFTYNSQTLANGSRFFVGSQMWEIDYDYQVGRPELHGRLRQRLVGDDHRRPRASHARPPRRRRPRPRRPGPPAAALTGRSRGFGRSDFAAPLTPRSRGFSTRGQRDAAHRIRRHRNRVANWPAGYNPAATWAAATGRRDGIPPLRRRRQPAGEA
jgi:autotransporter-associated beta strand protein